LSLLGGVFWRYCSSLIYILLVEYLDIWLAIIEFYETVMEEFLDIWLEVINEVNQLFRRNILLLRRNTRTYGLKLLV
jgi:hypothetical protein